MQFFVTTVLTAAMLVHATLGCCFHHSHTWESSERATASGVAQAGSSHCDGHARHEESYGRPDADDDQHQCPHNGPLHCKDVKCSFARTESSPDVQSLQLADCLAILALPAINAGVETKAASCVSDVAFDMPRLHLVLRVLLI